MRTSLINGALFLLALTSPVVARKLPFPRPHLRPWPHHSGKPFHHHHHDTKSCWVAGGADDDAPAILEAFHECNNGGTVVLDEDYTIASPLDLTFLNSVDVMISGTISMNDDVDYWTTHAFSYAYQTSYAFWRFGGSNVNIYGGDVGLIDGRGQAWYDAFALNATLVRPILLVLDGLNGGSVSGLHMINSPNWFNLVANSSDILISDMDIHVASNNENPAKNGDGWDTFRSDNVVIQDSTVNNSDDCVSFKPNSTNIIVQNMHCNGSHGISVGSLGQYPAEYDIVENIYVYNISMFNASDGARIKVWPGIDTPFQPALSGGGGAGYVKNVTYEHFYVENDDWAIEINQCYGQDNQTLCNMYPSNMTISDVVFKDMWGTTSSTYDPRVGTLICSSPDKCVNISAQDINVTPPSGDDPVWTCVNMDEDLLDITCVPAES